MVNEPAEAFGKSEIRDGMRIFRSIAEGRCPALLSYGP
jgi:hypothetical protein